MPPRSKLLWDEALGRYRERASGRLVTQKAVRDELDRALRNADRRIRALAEQLRANTISLDRWRLGMRQLAKEVHLYSAAAARGGWGQMTQAAYGQVGAIVRQEYGYLERFAADIGAGLPLDGHFLSRTELYSEAARETYHRAERDIMRAAGMAEERNVENRAAEHCEGPNSCPNQTARGWVPIGTLVPIGRRRCGRRCRCRVRYREAA